MKFNIFIKEWRRCSFPFYNVLGAHRYNLQSNGISTQFDILYPLYEEEEKNKNKLVKSFVSGLIGGFNYGTQVSAASAGVAALKGTTPKYNFADQKKLDKHYDKHVVKQGEFGNITKDQYLQKANVFADSKGSNVLTRTGSNGDVLKFNPSTNEFSIVTKDGVIRTYHKLDPNIHGSGTNMDYWNGPDCNY